MSLALRIATLSGIGALPWAPGSWGSLAALPLGYGLHWAGGFPLLAVATLAALALGLWAVGRAGERGAFDRKEFVIDELVGQWIALWPLSAGLWWAGVSGHVFPYPGWVTAFLAFRLFDIWKPGPIGWVDRRQTAWAVMADDVLAGSAAALVVLAAAWVAHGGF